MNNHSRKTAPGTGSLRQRGFSLVEVLVAMLILGVAVMSFAGLQVRALQSTGTAHLRSQGMTLAAEMIERIRANPSGSATYVSPALYGDPEDDIPAGEPASWGAASCVANDCTAAQMATFDSLEVQYLARELLPAGNVLVESCTGSALLVCVYIAWGGKESADCEDTPDANCVAMRVIIQ